MFGDEEDEDDDDELDEDELDELESLEDGVVESSRRCLRLDDDDRWWWCLLFLLLLCPRRRRRCLEADDEDEDEDDDAVDVVLEDAEDRLLDESRPLLAVLDRRVLGGDGELESEWMAVCQSTDGRRWGLGPLLVMMLLPLSDMLRAS